MYKNFCDFIIFTKYIFFNLCNLTISRYKARLRPLKRCWLTHEDIIRYESKNYTRNEQE